MPHARRMLGACVGGFPLGWDTVSVLVASSERALPLEQARVWCGRGCGLRARVCACVRVCVCARVCVCLGRGLTATDAQLHGSSRGMHSSVPAPAVAPSPEVVAVGISLFDALLAFASLRGADPSPEPAVVAAGGAWNGDGEGDAGSGVAWDPWVFKLSLLCAGGCIITTAPRGPGSVAPKQQSVASPMATNAHRFAPRFAMSTTACCEVMLGLG